MRNVHSPQRWFSLAFLFLFAMLTDLSAYSQTFSLTDTVRIMPLGNSITYGRYSVELRPAGMIPGYRQPLWQKLNEAGFHVNFVGTQSVGYNVIPAFDPDNEGHPGWRDDQIADSIYYWLTLNPADIILLHIGTNGLDSSPADVENILNEIDRYEQDNNDTITVLLARIINRSTYSSLTTLFNDSVQYMAQQRILAGDHIVMVDMENGAGIDYRLEPAGDMEDLLHPFETGYAKMAQQWFEFLAPRLPFNGVNFPPAPSGLNSPAKTYNSISIAFTDNSYSEQGFILERSSDSLSGYATLDTLAANSTNTTDTGLSPSTKYFYRLKAYNILGNSSYSNIISVTTAAAPSGDGLIAYWPVDNSGADMSGNAYNLSLVNGTTYSSDSQQGTQSLSLDGVDDYAVSPAIDLGNTFTLAMWVKMPSRSNIQTLIANGNSGAASYGFKLMVNTYASSDRRINFESGTGTVASISRSGTNVFDFGAWEHVALTVNRTTGEVHIFYNATDVTVDMGTHTGFKNNDVIRLGRMTNNSFGMQGLLDDVRIYNKVLSQPEIAAVMSGSVPPSINAPSSLNASLAGSDVQLTWTDNADNEDGFYLERSLSSTTGFSVIQTLAANQVTFTDNTVSEGVRYYYRIKAFNSDTESSYSNTATIIVVTVPPAAPSNLTAGSVTWNTLQLNWTDNATTEEGFYVERSADSLSGYTQIGTTGLNVTSYNDNSLTADTRYFYRVRAHNAIGNSAYSNILGVTTATAPSTGDGLIAYWPVDNSGADMSGNAYNLSLVNGTTYSSDSQQGTQSLSLDGVDDYAVSPAIDLGNTFTLAMWVKMPSRSNIQTLIANGNSGAASYGFKLMVNTYASSDRRINFESGTGTVASISRSGTNVFDFGAWEHVALTVNRTTGEVHIFYNATDVTVDMGTHTGFKNNDVIRLGRMTNNSFGMQGLLDDVRIYNKVLSQPEIAAVMSGSVPPSINAPSSLNASLAGSDVQLTWTDNADNENGFYLERSLSSTTGFSVIQTLAANQVTFTDNTVSEGVRYYYRIKAFNSDTESSYSNTATIIVVTVPPAAPSNLTAGSVTWNTLQLNWTDNATTEEGFYVERSADSLSGYTQIGTTGLNVTSYNDNSLTADTRYFYRVRAHNAIGNSAYSNILGVTTATAPSTGDGLIAYWPVDNSGADMSGNATTCLWSTVPPTPATASRARSPFHSTAWTTMPYLRPSTWVTPSPWPCGSRCLPVQTSRPLSLTVIPEPPLMASSLWSTHMPPATAGLTSSPVQAPLPVSPDPVPTSSISAPGNMWP